MTRVKVVAARVVNNRGLPGNEEDDRYKKYLFKKIWELAYGLSCKTLK